MKNILIIGLGWQGKKFLNYFSKLPSRYLVYGCCKSISTKKDIINKYGITVYLNYKKAFLYNNFDLIISTVFPTDIQYDIVKYILENTDYKVIIDLPITFNLQKLEYILSYEKLYLFNIEHYTKIFNIIDLYIDNIYKINATLLINKNNLKNQSDAKKSLSVDKFYMLNNILQIDYNKINIFYKEKNEPVKDVEFYFEFFLSDGNKIFYKYEDSKGIIIINNNLIIDNLNYSVVFEKLLINVFDNNFNIINFKYKKKHLSFWSNFIN